MRYFTSLVLFALALGCGVATAQTSTTLCSPPQDPDCVVPQWGSIHPDDPDSGSLVGPSSPTAASRSVDRPALVRIALSTGKTASVAPKIVIDDGKKYARETKSLVAALKAARFDAEGKLISGAERITTALERVNKVSSNHMLTLYLKASTKLSDADRSVLDRKVADLNVVLEGGSQRK